MTGDTAKVAATYDTAMYVDDVNDMWNNSGFCNFGYWRPDTTTQQRACENLLDRLLALIPEKHGRILDVACGMGATTRHLAQYFRPHDIVGVNISHKQLCTAAGRAPGSSFARMDAVNLAFQSAAFDHIICVEAAFHFDTRLDFLREAWRLLKPGGRLVMSDMLAKAWVARVKSSATVRNMDMSLEAYRQQLVTAGFTDVQAVDATPEVVSGMCRYHRRWSADRLKRSWDPRPVARLMLFDAAMLASTRHYLLVSAQKPA